MDIDLFLNYCFNQNTFLNIFFDNEKPFVNEKDILQKFLHRLYHTFKFKIERFGPTKPSYPNYMLLGNDKGILAYLDFHIILHPGISPLSHGLEYALGIVSKGLSELDRPIFVIYIMATPNITGIYFETDEQIKDRLFYDKTSLSVDKKKYIPDLKTLGDINNLIRLFKKLKDCH